MNWKLIIIGALAFWLVTNVIGFLGTGWIIHDRILDPIYRANESFWIPPLRQDPPDMAAVMPQWLLTSLLSSLVVAGIYSRVHTSFNGPGWKKGPQLGAVPGDFHFHELYGIVGALRPAHETLGLVGDRRIDPLSDRRGCPGLGGPEIRGRLEVGARLDRNEFATKQQLDTICETLTPATNNSSTSPCSYSEAC